MKCLKLLLILLILYFLPPSNFAKAGDVGLGIIFGEPTAVTGKVFLKKHSAFDFGVSFWHKNFFEVYADYLKHLASEPVDPYVGIGLSFSHESHDYYSSYYHRCSYRSEEPYCHNERFGLGVRVPLGIEFRPEGLRALGLFGEIALRLQIVPYAYGELDGGIGVRFYF